MDQTPSFSSDIKLRISVMGLFIKSDTVLMLHKMTGPQPDRWDLPGGGLIPGESLMQALKREIIEETGTEHFQVENLLLIAEDFFPEWAGRSLHSLSIIYKCSLEGNPSLISSDPKEVGPEGTQWIPITGLSSATCTTRSLKALEAANMLTLQANA